MSDIGPGDWVVATISHSHHFGYSVTAGSLYQVADRLVVASVEPCRFCGNSARDAFTLKGKRPERLVWCPCAFRKWPGEADEELRSEGVDADEEQPSKHPAVIPA